MDRKMLRAVALGDDARIVGIVEEVRSVRYAGKPPAFR